MLIPIYQTLYLTIHTYPYPYPYPYYIGASSPAPMLKKSPSDFSFLRSKVGLLEVRVDFSKSRLLEDQVTQCGVKVVGMALEVERLNKYLFEVLIECVGRYNSSEMYVERYKTFDKLTAMLGKGEGTYT
ncbi:hypothetical protein EON63_23440 [archaeon]|nr:MAG: hypothetical protein EON63_23440 [archaeon]